MILLSAIKVWLWVQRDGGIWSFPTWTGNRLSLHRHPASGNESWGGEGGDPSDSPRKSLWPSPRIGWSRIKVMFSVPDLLQQILFVLRLEKWFFHLCGKYYFLCIESCWVDFRCVHRFQLLNVCNHMSPFQISPAYRAYPRNNPSKTFLQSDEFLTGLSQKCGNTQPVNQTEWLVL